jgi:TolA-binding protein
MTNKKHGHAIDIERNPIEKVIMAFQEKIRSHRNLTIYSTLAIVFVIALTILAVVLRENISDKNNRRFEQIVSKYENNPNESSQTDKAVSELKTFIDNTSFGDARIKACYMLGNVYYTQKKFKEAHYYLKMFADSSSSAIFTPIALLKSAIALEEAGDNKGALALYNDLEEDHGQSAIADQIFYNYARICKKNNDIFNARKYYNRVMAAYPNSVLAEKAKKGLMLLGVRK